MSIERNRRPPSVHQVLFLEALRRTNDLFALFVMYAGAGPGVLQLRWERR